MRAARRDGLPPGLLFLLGVRVGDGPVVGKDSTSVFIGSRGWCHILPSGITLTLLGESSTLALSRLRRTYGPSEGEGTGLLPSPSRLMGLAHPPCFIDISAMLLCNMADMSLPRGEGTPRPHRLRGWIPALSGRNDGEGEGKAIRRSHLRGGKGSQERCWYGEGRATSRSPLREGMEAGVGVGMVGGVGR